MGSPRLQVTSTQEFATLLARGYELRSVEFKGPGPRTDAILRAKVIRAMLGMANLRDGGRVIIGVDETDTGPAARGLSQADLATWQYDEVATAVAEYADPYLQFDVERRDYDGAWYTILHVYEFDEIPILCRRDLSFKVNGRDKPILRRGGLYVRSRHKPETAEVRTQEEMREILEMAMDKGIRRFVERAHNVGLSTQLFGPGRFSDAARFGQQGQDLA